MTPSILFQWDYSDPYDGFQLYENGALIVDDIGETHFTLLMDGKDYGDYQYYVTTKRDGLISEPSNTVVVNFTLPAAPTNLRAKLSG
jgi:hypothetical protein